MGYFERFVDYIYELSQVDIHNCELERQVYNCLIDYSAALIGGFRLWNGKVSCILNNVFENGDYHVAGFKDVVPLETALLSNGLISHVAELDDGVIKGIIHPGAPIFTAIFSVFQKTAIDWNLFVKSITIGYEVACRIAEAIQPSHKLLGYHASATCGTIGVALALAIISRFDKKHMREALSIAMVSSHGTLKVLEDKSELKPYNIASAVINGYVAFQMAKAGFKGADDPFEGEAGFFAQMAKDVKYDSLIGNTDNLCINRAYFKPYASCRYTHPAIEAALEIKNQYNILPEQIEDIQIATYSIAIHHHNHTEVPNVSSAKMSIPFGVAVGLIKGSGGIDAFCDETVENVGIKSLTRRVRVVEDVKYSAQFPKKSVATMRVRMKKGKEYSCTVDMPKGELGNPMTQEDLFLKLRKSCEFAGFEFEGIRRVLEDFRYNEIIDFFGSINKFHSN